jgi:hypothetical protein
MTSDGIRIVGDDVDDDADAEAEEEDEREVAMVA